MSLASKEYARLVRPELLPVPLVTVSFHEEHEGRLRTVGMYAKNARGRLARWIVTNRLRDPDALRVFDADGYRFREDLSGPEEYVFTRPSVG
ncbi:MAG: peroxide stress protein YaaA [Spirochaetota bacterium]